MQRLTFLAFILLAACACSVSKLPLDASTMENPSTYVDSAKGRAFANFHAVLINGNRLEMEGEGMYFTIEKINLPHTQKSVNKIKNAYMPNGDIYHLGKIELPTPNLVLLGGEAITAQYSSTSLLFIVPAPDSAMYAIQAESAFMLEFERAGGLVREIVQNGVPEYVLTAANATSVDFVGRPLQLGNRCEWQGAHQVSCPGLGQLEWSLFQTADDANLAMQINMALTEARSEKLLEKTENVAVTFEGKPIKATRAIYKMPVANEGNSDKMTAYFISSTVRGHHVFCKASFYENEAEDGRLSPLAAKVIAY